MKYDIISFFRTVVATIMAFLVSVTGLFGTADEPQVPVDENMIFVYDNDAADYGLSINPDEELHDISELLFGIFFEDINFAADGGLYAEKVVNRSFEYTEIAANDQLYGWNTVGNAEIAVILNDSENYLNENNVNYLVIKNNSGAKAGVENRGFLDGMAIEENENYNISFYAKSSDYSGKFTLRLAVDGEAVAEKILIDFSVN